MIAAIGEGADVNSVGGRAVADHVVGSTLGGLRRLTSLLGGGKRRKIGEVKYLGAEVFDVDEERPTLQQRIARVGEEVVHGGSSRDMQRRWGSSFKAGEIARPASSPNMLQEDTGFVFPACESKERWALPGRDGAVVPCGSSANCVCGSEALEARAPCSESWDFKVTASVKVQNRNLVSTDVIGTIAFERTNEFFATGGIARKIRVYAYSSLASGTSSSDEVDDEDDDEEDSSAYYKERRLRKRGNCTTDIDHARCCVREVCTPAKLSSLQWHQERPNLIACGDYDGVVAEWDIERNCAVSERDETGGQRIWSIDYSKDFPDLISSASDDGTVRLWDRSSEQSVAILTPPPTYTSICCAEFGPASSSLIALASADSNVYLYDTRWLSAPLLTLSHHKRAASYVRFLSRHSLVSASIDSSVKLWDISAAGRTSSPAASAHCYAPMKTFDSHYNVRNFTGLSVRAEGGLIACGSETNQAFVYDSRQFSPILTHSFDYSVHHPNPPLGSSWSSNTLANPHHLRHSEGDAVAANIVSAVCWRPKPDDCTLVAANSDGVLRVLQGTLKS